MLHIIIKGKAGEGKTTAAILIAKALSNCGFNATINDTDVKELGAKEVTKYVKRRIENKSFSGKEVIIETQQIKKAAKKL